MAIAFTLGLPKYSPWFLLCRMYHFDWGEEIGSGPGIES
jgi:hypothetical protein